MTRVDVYRSTLEHFLAPVADLLYRDETVSEVLINGAKKIYLERDGKLIATEREFASDEALVRAITNLAEFVNRRLDVDHHSMDARLPEPHQFRVHAIIPPASRNGVCVSIRKFKQSTITLNRLVEWGSLTPTAMEYLNLMVKSHRNLVVSGGVSTGKTSLLNALSTAIDSRERVIVIEDSSELKLNQPHVLYLEAGQRDSTGKKTVTIRDLFVDSLRMRPDRIMVGEVRRGEALDLVQSMLSGHDGAMTTVHASNPFLALVRLETLCLMSDVHMPVYVARTQVASAVHVVVQVSRLADGSRRITGISEVLPLDAKDRYRLRPIFRFVRRGTSPQGRVLGELEPTGKPSRYRKELRLSEFTDEIRLSEAIFPVG